MKKLLATGSDWDLCNGICKLIVNHYGDDIDASEIPQEERTVLLVWHASGVIANGGFRYLFEGDLKGDPYFALTAEAFQTIGCRQAADAVRQTLAMFPDSRPPRNVNRRLKYYRSQVKSWPTEMDVQFFQAKDERDRCLAAYIRAHAQAYERLEGGAVARRARQRQEDTEEVPCPESTLGERIAGFFFRVFGAFGRRKTSPQQRPMEVVPHWARVAFAARCARQVLPLFGEYWPQARSERANAITQAIERAEQSASLGRAVDGLKEAALNALMAAGGALATDPSFSGDEPKPNDAFSGTIACQAAKSAEYAARCALASPQGSAEAALEALTFAQSAAGDADRADIVELIEEEFDRISSAAACENWTDHTPVPTGVWELL